MAVLEVYHQEGLGNVIASPRHVTLFRQALNILCCILSLPLYWIITVHCRWPITLDLITTVALTELNRYVNEGRRMAFHEEVAPPPYSEDESDAEMEKKMLADIEFVHPEKRDLECLAAVVGWREDPSLFTRALESYKQADGCSFVLVGIDGDEAPDMDMVNVFNKVFPKCSQVIHVPEPLGEVAQLVCAKERAMREKYGYSLDETEIHEVAMRHCLSLARSLLAQAEVSFSGPNAVRQLCLRQRHMHKKGIMFTSYIFSLVIADVLGIEYMWSSDSDTLVMKDSITRTVDSMAADLGIGGASSGLVVHNSQDSTITRLAETVYWGELYLTRSTPGATATSDCQSGPSTCFRLAALPAILVPWYGQTIFGKRMIINEDRHLTTNLLARGWGVVFASDVLTSTDTPTTLARWLRQQVRWARATHIESLLVPKVYAMSHPLLFYGTARRELGPLIAAVAILYYFFTAQKLIAVSAADLALRSLVSSVYNVLRNPHRLSRESLAWVLPGMAFYHVPLPAVHVWSMFTLTADGWGTSMRASGERAKKDDVWQAWWETGFFVVWMMIVAGCVARYMAGHLLAGLDESMTVMMMAITMGAAGYMSWAVTVRTDT